MRQVQRGRTGTPARDAAGPADATSALRRMTTFMANRASAAWSAMVFGKWRPRVERHGFRKWRPPHGAPGFSENGVRAWSAMVFGIWRLRVERPRRAGWPGGVSPADGVPP